MTSESSGAKRIAAAIVAAGLIVALVPVLRDAIQEWRVRRALETFTAQVEASDKEAQRQAAIRAYHSSSAAAAHIEAKRLRSGEQCTAGTVLRRVDQPAKGWVQVLEGGRPVRCADGMRL